MAHWAKLSVTCLNGALDAKSKGIGEFTRCEKFETHHVSGQSSHVNFISPTPVTDKQVTKSFQSTASSLPTANRGFSSFSIGRPL